VPWPWLTILAKNIPWGELVRRAPDIVEGSRQLLDSSRKLGQRTPGSAQQSGEQQLQARIAALEAREVEQAKIVEQMAEQIDGLTAVVKVLAWQNRIWRGVMVGLCIFVFVLFVRSLRG
jgi:hypothetical protein